MQGFKTWCFQKKTNYERAYMQGFKGWYLNKRTNQEKVTYARIQGKVPSQKN